MKRGIIRHPPHHDRGNAWTGWNLLRVTIAKEGRQVGVKIAVVRHILCGRPLNKRCSGRDRQFEVQRDPAVITFTSRAVVGDVANVRTDDAAILSDGKPTGAHVIGPAKDECIFPNDHDRAPMAPASARRPASVILTRAISIALPPPPTRSVLAVASPVRISSTNISTVTPWAKRQHFGAARRRTRKLFERAAAVGLGAVVTAAGLRHEVVAAVRRRCP